MKKTKARRFLLVDGNLLLHKSYGIHHKLSIDVDGERIQTGVPYGFIRTLVRLSDKYKPCNVCLIFDHSVTPEKLKKEKPHRGRFAKDTMPRRIVYSDYKGTRSELKPEIAAGKKLLDKILNCLGVTVVYASESYEADDVVSYVTKRCSLHPPCEVVIVSDDKDFNQLIKKTKDLDVFTHKRGDEVLNRTAFEKKFGFPPSLFVNYLSLMGDSGDDIPGIKGFGPKRAGELTCKGLKAIYEGLDASQRVIYERNQTLIRLSTSRRVIVALNHGKLKEERLKKVLTKYKMISFLRERDFGTLCALKPIKFLKEY